MELTCMKNYFIINNDDEFESPSTIELTSIVFSRCLGATGDTKIAFTVQHKSPGSMSQGRFDIYSKGRFLAKALQKGATPQDLTYKQFMKTGQSA